LGVAVGVGVGVGVAVGAGVGDGPGVAVAVGTAVTVGRDVALGEEVDVGSLSSSEPEQAVIARATTRARMASGASRARNVNRFNRCTYLISSNWYSSVSSVMST
jgi:hypothetical protein